MKTVTFKKALLIITALYTIVCALAIANDSLKLGEALWLTSCLSIFYGLLWATYKAGEKWGKL